MAARKTIFIVAFAVVLTVLVASLGGIRAFLSAGQNVENIVFLTIDTLRADHVGSYGYPRNTTPFLDSLAAKGVRFSEARSAASHTAPSHTSMFTSLYPFQHQVLRNQERLKKGVYNISDMAKELGFEVAAFPAVKFLEGKVGFDVVHSSVPLPEGISKKAWYRNAKNVVDRVETWFGQRKNTGKLFLWVHMYDVHMWEGEANIPQEYLKRYSLQDLAHAEYILKNHNMPLSYHKDSQEKLLKAINGYDARLNFVDDQVKRLYNLLEQKGINKNSMWVITSDHGEGLGNHHYHGHGQFIYEEQLHVPLIVTFNPQRSAGTVVDQLVRSVDLFPTIAELLGKKLPAQDLGLQGLSFASVFRGDDAGVSSELLAFAQRRPKAMDRLRKDWEEGDVYALQSDAAKLIEHTDGADQFFDLKADPFEMNNISGKGDPREEEYRAHMNQLMASAKKYEASPKNQKLKPKQVEELKALGYM